MEELNESINTSKKNDKPYDIGVIGQGFVGTAVREKFKEHFNVWAYDKKWNDIKVFNSSKPIHIDSETPYETVTLHSSIIFICVPTPMDEDGNCYTGIVESVLDEISESCKKHKIKRTVVIKSTVVPGTTERLNKKYNSTLNVVFNPEFLREATAITDYENQKHVILGIQPGLAPYEVSETDKIISIFTKAFGKNVKIKLTDPTTAELVKYTINSFLAVKVSFFNEIYDIAKTLGVDYDQLISSVLLDERIGKSHYKVPGPDGHRGYGGICLPKDISALINLANDNKVHTPVLLGSIIKNHEVREEKDWEKEEGRAVINNSDKNEL